MSILVTLGVGAIVGGLAGGLGSLMMGRRMSLVGGPLGHLALPGVALALLLSANIFLGALFSIVLGIVFIWFLEGRTDLPTEALTGLIFASGVAVGFLLLPLSEAEEVVVGNITEVGLFDLFLSVGVALFVLVLVKMVYRKVVLSALSEELALGKGIEARKVSFLYLLAIGAVTALEVKIVGILLTAALFVIPASCARNLARGLRGYSFLSIFFGVLSTTLGILVWRATLVPAGPLIITSSSFLFLVSLLFKNVKG